MIFLRRENSPFIKVKKKKKRLNIELGKTNKIKLKQKANLWLLVLSSKHAIILAAVYRPPRSDQACMDTANQTLST